MVPVCRLRHRCSGLRWSPPARPQPKLDRWIGYALARPRIERVEKAGLAEITGIAHAPGNTERRVGDREHHGPAAIMTGERGDRRVGGFGLRRRVARRDDRRNGSRDLLAGCGWLCSI